MKTILTYAIQANNLPLFQLLVDALVEQSYYKPLFAVEHIPPFQMDKALNKILINIQWEKCQTLELTVDPDIIHYEFGSEKNSDKKKSDE